MRLFKDLKEELAEQSLPTVRLTLSLCGKSAEQFVALHQQLGGENVISRNALAGRIIAKALSSGATTRHTERQTKRDQGNSSD
jgi:hypothetical protein